MSEKEGGMQKYLLIMWSSATHDTPTHSITLSQKHRESILSFMYTLTHTHTHTHLQDVIVQHSLPLVSFSADVKRTKQEIFSYIAKTSPKAKEYICYAFEVPRGQVRS